MEEPILSEEVLLRLAMPLYKNLDKIYAYYDNPENEKRFQEWHFQKYGVYAEPWRGKKSEEKTR